MIFLLKCLVNVYFVMCSQQAADNMNHDYIKRV